MPCWKKKGLCPLISYRHFECESSMIDFCTSYVCMYIRVIDVMLDNQGCNISGAFYSYAECVESKYLRLVGRSLVDQPSWFLISVRALLNLPCPEIITAQVSNDKEKRQQHLRTAATLCFYKDWLSTIELRCFSTGVAGLNIGSLEDGKLLRYYFSMCL